MKTKTIDIRKYLSKKDRKIGDKFAKNMDELFLKAVDECEEWLYPAIQIINFTEQMIDDIYKVFIKKESKDPTNYGINVMQYLNESLKQLSVTKGILAGMLDKVVEEEERIMEEEMEEKNET